MADTTWKDVFANAVRDISKQINTGNKTGDWSGIPKRNDTTPSPAAQSGITPKGQDAVQYKNVQGMKLPTLNIPKNEESDKSLTWGDFSNNNLIMDNGFLNPSYAEAAQTWGYQPEKNEKPADNSNEDANWQMSYLAEKTLDPQFMTYLANDPNAMTLNEGYIPAISAGGDTSKNMYEAWVEPKKIERRDAENAAAAADPNNLAKTNDFYRNQFGGQWMTDMSGNTRTDDLFKIDPNTGKLQNWNYSVGNWVDTPEGMWNPKTGRLDLKVGGRQAQTMDDVEMAMYMLLYGYDPTYGDNWGKYQFDTGNPNYDKFWEFTQSEGSPVGEHYKWLRDADIWGEPGYSYDAYKNWISANPLDMATADPLRFMALEGTSALGMASTNDYLSESGMPIWYLDAANMTPEQMSAFGYTQDMIDSEADKYGRIPLNMPGSDGITNMLSAYKYLGDDDLRSILGDTPFTETEMNQLLGIYGDDDPLKYTRPSNPEDYDIEGARERYYDPYARLVDPGQIDYSTMVYNDVPIDDILALLEGDLSNYGTGLYRTSEYA